MASAHSVLLLVLPVAAACNADKPFPPSTDPRVVWVAQIPRAAVIPTADSAHVYFADRNHTLYAVDRATGKTCWSSRNAGGDVFGSTAGFGLAIAGAVVAIPDGFVFGLDRTTGALRWEFHLPNTGFSWRLASDGETIYAPSGDGRVFAIDPTSGTARWEARVADDTGGAAFTSLVFRDTLYVGYLRRTNPRTGGLGALDAKTGARIWYTEFSPVLANSPSSSHGDVAIVNDLVVVASDGGEIHALERASGVERWQTPRIPGGAVGDVRPTIAVGQLVLAGSTFEKVTAYDATTGAQAWQQTLLGSLQFPFVTDGRRAFVVDGAGRLVALESATGAIAWTFGSNIASQGPMLVGAIVKDSVVYIGGEKAAYALRAYDP